jgi:hypothetical protein
MSRDLVAWYRAVDFGVERELELLIGHEENFFPTTATCSPCRNEMPKGEGSGTDTAPRAVSLFSMYERMRLPGGYLPMLIHPHQMEDALAQINADHPHFHMGSS